MICEYKRTLSELVFMYSVETELNDVYVEGITDKLVLDRLMKKNNCNDFSIILINDINFSELYSTSPHIKKNNKLKAVELSIFLENEFANRLKKVKCVVDKDFDNYLNLLISNNYLLYTDFNSIEMYLFNENCINIFLKNILRETFPFPASVILKEIESPLVDMYFLKLVIKQRGEITDLDRIPDIKKSIKSDKLSGSLSYNLDSFLAKVLGNFGLRNLLDSYKSDIEFEKSNGCNEVRNQIRGHDFVHVLFLYINSIKNNFGLTEETLERFLFQCIDFSELKKHNLFKSLITVYS